MEREGEEEKTEKIAVKITFKVVYKFCLQFSLANIFAWLLILHCLRDHDVHHRAP